MNPDECSMKFLFSNFNNIEGTHLNMNYGHAHYQYMLLDSQFLKRDLTLVLDPSCFCQLTTSWFCSSTFCLFTQLSNRCYFGCYGVISALTSCPLLKLPEIIASIGLLLCFTASGTRENKVCVILSCFVHGCLNSLTPRYMLPGLQPLELNYS